MALLCSPEHCTPIREIQRELVLMRRHRAELDDVIQILQRLVDYPIAPALEALQGGARRRFRGAIETD